MILIDSNVLLDVAYPDPNWYDWSASQLAEAGERFTLCINPVIYAETCVGYSRPEEFDDAFPAATFHRLELPYKAAFLAGKAHAAYRRKGGRHVSTLPDFFIGAHALVAGYKILTRDPRRFRRYFPAVELICP